MAENKLLTPALPDLIIEEATEEGGIDLDRVTQGATVFIPASANLQAQDQVRIAVTGAYSDSKTHSVIQPGEQRFKIDYSVIKANENGSIGVTYFVQPGGNPPEQSTGTVEYDVRATVGKGLLQVLGARHTRSAQRAAYASRYLRAYQADTGQPIMAEWRYCGSPEWSSAGEWLDSQPHLPLQVRAEHDLVTLNPANIIGNGIYMSSPTGIGAFVALRNDGRVVGWGDADNGGLIPTVIRTLDDVVEVSCTSGAYAARRADGSIVVWGVPTEGGDLGEVSPEGFREVIGNAQAFAGIKETGAVVAWGASGAGATVPEPIAALTDIVRVVAAGNAFAALRNGKQVVAWGVSAFGGTVPEEILALTDIEDVMGNSAAFAARRTNGTLVAWGEGDSGGNADPVAPYTDIVRLCCSNLEAFVAQRVTGHLVAWGANTAGGTLPAEIEVLSDVIDVVSTSSAFAAVRRNGSVVAWGAERSGGTPPAEISELVNVAQVVGSSHAFAVLCQDGTVKAWGDTTVGGDTTPVASELVDIQALYANTHGFVALRRDGRVISWGNQAGGGDNSAVRDQIDTYVTYRATSASRGRALLGRQRQSVIAAN